MKSYTCLSSNRKRSYSRILSPISKTKKDSSYSPSSKNIPSILTKSEKNTSLRVLRGHSNISITHKENVSPHAENNTSYITKSPQKLSQWMYSSTSPKQKFFQSLFNEEMNTTKSDIFYEKMEDNESEEDLLLYSAPRKENQVLQFHRRLDSLARIFSAGYTCVALSLIENKLLIASNDLHKTSLENNHVQLIEEIYTYFQNSLYKTVTSNHRVDFIKKLCLQEKKILFQKNASYINDDVVIKSIDSSIMLLQKGQNLKDATGILDFVKRIIIDVVKIERYLHDTFLLLSDLTEKETLQRHSLVCSFHNSNYYIIKEGPKNMHAEMRIIAYVLSHYLYTLREAFYIAISKLSCLNCQLVIDAINQSEMFSIFYNIVSKEIKYDPITNRGSSGINFSWLEPKFLNQYPEVKILYLSLKKGTIVSRVERGKNMLPNYSDSDTSCQSSPIKEKSPQKLIRDNITPEEQELYSLFQKLSISSRKKLSKFVEEDFKEEDSCREYLERNFNNVQTIILHKHASITNDLKNIVFDDYENNKVGRAKALFENIDKNVSEDIKNKLYEYFFNENKAEFRSNMLDRIHLLEKHFFRERNMQVLSPKT